MLTLLAAFAVVAGSATVSALARESGDHAKPSRAPVPFPAGDTIGDLALRVVARDVFRVARVPAALPYAGRNATVTTPPRPPRPALVLSGILGPPWQALLEGIPGHDGGRFVRMGDTVAGLRITSIRGDTVTVRGADTTWKLTVRRAW